jgi:serine protease AprX
MLVFSLVSVSAAPYTATIHVQTFGYEGRDVVQLYVEVTGEDSDYLFVSFESSVLNTIAKEINIEKLPFIQIGETAFKIPKTYLIQMGTNEYVMLVPNNVAKIKWNLRDQTADMADADIVTVLVWFKEPGVFETVEMYGTVTYAFLSDMGAVVNIRVSDIKGLSEEGVIEFVEADEIRYTTLKDSIPLIKADACWEEGYDGTGVNICVIDTGIDPDHCDFPTGKIVAWADYINGQPNPYDDHGHGTHVSSIAAGAYDPMGVAPGASLIAAKVCNAGGSCPDSAIIQGIDFGVDKEADVENLSLGGPGGDGTSAIALECDWAVSQGVVVCVAAGNSGPSCCTTETPGDARDVITVGASTKSDALASFSSRGPTTDDRTKPDITAPGVAIFAAQAGTPCGDIAMSGTSMATPHIAGVAALMLHANNAATPKQIKNCMGASAIDKFNPGKDCLWGWGRVDAYAAVQQVMNNPDVKPPADAEDRGCDPPQVVIKKPVDGSKVYSGEFVGITTSSTDCISMVKFYLVWIADDGSVVGELLCTDYAPPFECVWDTTGYTVGKWYTIRADGYWHGQVWDVDEITVQLCPSCSTDHPGQILIHSFGDGLGMALLIFLLLSGCAGIITKRAPTDVNKRKKAAALTVMLVLSLSIPAALSSKDTFTVEYTFTPAPMEGCGPWMVEDTLIREIPGEPLIPYRPASILLPYNATVKDVKVKHKDPVIQKGIDIPWGQPPCTFSGPKPEKVDKSNVYDTDNQYPDTLFEITGVESFKGFKILNVNLYPVQYKPKSGTVYFYETLTVEVKFGNDKKDPLYRGLPDDCHDVTSIVDNPDMINTYEDAPIPFTTEEYIIITNDDLECIFQQLADYKSCYVSGATVYTVSWIYATYPGVDNQEKIRNFIIDKYTNNGTEYVLLGGDVDVIPYRLFYVNGTYIAADMYYAHLHGTFDADSDGIYAEPGEVDWYSEVAVGRAPVETTTEAWNFVNKVMDYEKMGKPERVLLHQSRANGTNNPDTRCLAWNCDDWVPVHYTFDYLFEEDGTVTKALWRQYWDYNPVAVAHIGHGSSTSYYLNYNNGGNVTWLNADIATLTNTFYPWHTTVACMTGDFTVNDCLAEEYVKDPDNGAIATYMNYSYGWYSYTDACMYSGEFCEMEFKACFTDGRENLGDILNQARSYLVSSAQTNNTYRYCFYERNLIGDPESPCLTQRISVVDITSPLDGQNVYNGGLILITTATKGHVASVKFYLIYISGGGVVGELLCEDTIAPFECVWDPTGYTTGIWYTIRADAYFCDQVKDVDEISVRLLPS